MSDPVALFMPYDYAFAQAVSTAALQRLRMSGRNVLMVGAGVSLDDLIAGGRLSGIIGWLTGGGQNPDPTVIHRRCHAAGIPMVCTSSRCDPRPLPAVVSDNHAIGAMAADHLVELGCRSFVAASIGTWFADERRAGFLDRLGERDRRGQIFPAGLSATAVLPALTTAAGLEWLAGLPQPIGLFASNDQHARRLAQQLTAKGWQLPDQLALVGVDDDPGMCLSADPELTSIDPDGATIGKRAAELLLRLLDGAASPVRPLRVPPRGLIERASTGAPTCDDAVISAALRFIRAQAHRPIAVASIVVAVNCQRRSLERRMRAAIGRSPAEELCRVRTSKALVLLRQRGRSGQHELPLRVVARQSGFGTVHRLIAAVRRCTGFTPGRLRARGG